MLLKSPENRQRGQAIMLVAITLVGLIAMIGLLIDGGAVFIQSSRLKRAIDAAAVAAALQFREGYSDADIVAAAQEFILLNEGETYDIEVFLCDETEFATNPAYEHADLCTTPRRKLVRIRGTNDLVFNFLPIIGIDGTSITSDSVGEAASVDVVIVIDASLSMADLTDGIAGPGPGDDPALCNFNHDCQPFEDIKNVAKDFIDTLFFPYDRVAVVTFERSPHLATYGGTSWQQSRSDARNLIDSLIVFQPETCDFPNHTPAIGPCLNRPDGINYVGQGCVPWTDSTTSPKNPTSCTSSNIGGGLVTAGNQFAQAPIREDSLWVVILLAGGPANATDPVAGFPYGACPESAWAQPLCRDDDAASRHAIGELDYDGDDYARDMADFIVDPFTGQGAVIYSIGLGDKVQNDRIRGTDGDPDIAEQFLEYAATRAGGVNDQGIYYYAPNAAELRDVFRSIAENIATRISQ